MLYYAVLYLAQIAIIYHLIKKILTLRSDKPNWLLISLILRAGMPKGIFYWLIYFTTLMNNPNLTELDVYLSNAKPCIVCKIRNIRIRIQLTYTFTWIEVIDGCPQMVLFWKPVKTLLFWRTSGDRQTLSDYWWNNVTWSLWMDMMAQEEWLIVGSCGLKVLIGLVILLWN